MRNPAARTLIDVALAVCIAFTAWQTFRGAMESANLKANVRNVTREAKLLHTALQRYYDSIGNYPNAYESPGFDTESLDPLRRRGYYKGSINAKLLGGRIDAYDSPDDRGVNQEFWIEMSLQSDPSIRFLIARSDDAPLAGGVWREGVFILRRGKLEQL